MSDNSHIQWTDATWNPTTGCTKVSPGCANCYIERTPAFRINGRKFVNGATDLQLHRNRLDQPLHWRKPRRVFVNSLSDLFHDDVPETFILSVFTTMQRSPQHTFQILTKRPKRMREIVEWVGRKFADEGEAFPLPNVWLGVSVESQRFVDERIPLLLQTPAAVRFISAEPLLGHVRLKPFMPKPMYHCSECGIEKMRSHCDKCGTYDNLATNQIGGLDWVIVGGESGPKSRPFDVEWARSIVAQCKAAGVPCFVKQLGAAAESRCDQCGRTIGRSVIGGFVDICGPTHAAIVSEHQRIRHSKGGQINEWPEDLRVREFPAV